MPSKFEILLSWLGLPIYIWQGLGVRRRTVRMAPPTPQPVVELAGKGKPVSILFMGDSSAAGVGVDDFDQCVAGRLPQLLSKALKRPIFQKTSGNNSATAGRLRDHVLPNIEHYPYDYVIVSIGVNDAKNFHSGKRFCNEFGTLLYALHARFPDATIIWQGLLDMEGVPALPHPLNKLLGIRSRLLRKHGKQLCFERLALAPDTSWEPVPENFSSDGFHASAEGYRVWAEELSEFIIDLERR